jgi:hypothetical protein
MKVVILKPDDGCLVSIRPGEAVYLVFTVRFAKIRQVVCAGKNTNLVKARILRDVPEEPDEAWNWDREQKKRFAKQEEERLALSPAFQLDSSEDEEATEESLDSFLSLMTLSGEARSDPPFDTREVRKKFVLSLRAFLHAKTPVDLCAGVLAWVPN